MIIKLSNSDSTFSYLGNSFNQFPDFQTLIVPAGDHNFSEIESAFAGNDLITVADEEQIVITLRDYVNIRSITKDNSYVVGYKEDGTPVTESVYAISLEKEDVNVKVKNLETNLEEFESTLDLILTDVIPGLLGN